ncbi:MAG TPA: hypothetical protein VEK76_05080 [Candidatus Binatia bacterium]|nr:hypothetical protein [Candidatus Binatia bacterium]
MGGPRGQSGRVAAARLRAAASALLGLVILLAGCGSSTAGSLLDTAGLTQVEISYYPGYGPSGGQWEVTLTSAHQLQQFDGLVRTRHIGIVLTPTASVPADCPQYGITLLKGSARTDLTEGECSTGQFSGNVTGDVSGFLGDLTTVWGTADATPRPFLSA